MKNKSFYTLIIAFMMSSLAQAHCNDISGVYVIQPSQMNQVSAINPVRTEEASCQILKDGAGSFLIPNGLLSHWINPSTYPNGLRIYVYPKSDDLCDFHTVVSFPQMGVTPVLDQISYNDFKKQYLTSDFEIDREKMKLPVIIGTMDYSGMYSHGDGKMMELRSSERNGYIKVQNNGDIVDYLETKKSSTKYLVVPTSETHATSCSYKKVE